MKHSTHRFAQRGKKEEFLAEMREQAHRNAHREILQPAAYYSISRSDPVTERVRFGLCKYTGGFFQKLL
jgi:hypothetical protein